MKALPKLIAITGGSGAGKTRLARGLQEVFGARAARLSMDDFYRDLRHLSAGARARVNFDRPDSLDWPGFEAVLRQCRAGRATRVPQYDFTTHTRRPEVTGFDPAPLVLVEGLWLLSFPRLAELFDLKIFIDCPMALRLERRLSRDLAARARTPESIREQFARHVAPMHEQFVAPQAGLADLVLTGPLEEPELRRLVQTIRATLLKRGAGKITAPACQKACGSDN